MELDKILPNELAGGVVDNDENVHTQERDYYNTASSENKYSTSVPNLPSMQHICNIFLGLDLKATDLNVNYDSDGNELSSSTRDNIDGSGEVILD